MNKTTEKYEKRKRFYKYAKEALITKNEIKERTKNGEELDTILNEKGIELVAPINLNNNKNGKI